MPYFSQDDIAQIGTPPANALVGVIRVSGPNAFAILQRTVRGCDDALKHPERSMHDCRFLLPLVPLRQETSSEPDTNEDAKPVVFPCPVRVLLMPGPNSYTTEDVAEIHFPGSVPVLKAALGALVAAGARPAAPGEFTFRAFRGGRLSLRQAEAVEEVIRAGNDAERRRALARLGDATEGRIRQWRDRLADCAALVEASLDFAEEEIEVQALADMLALADELEGEAGTIVRRDRDVAQGRPEAALVGLANAGKSSLLNALLCEDTVLVSAEASTTRDSIRRDVVWDGVRLIVSDNPGFDPEREGVGGMAASRAVERIAGHDLAVWVVDSSLPVDDALKAFSRTLPDAVVVALNKRDKPEAITPDEIRAFAECYGVALSETVCVSAATGEGLEALKSAVAARAAALHVAGPWNRREVWELAAARTCCRAAVAELEGAGRLELVSEELRYGLAAFSRALGEGYAEDTLTRIFSRFCIGK